MRRIDEFRKDRAANPSAYRQATETRRKVQFESSHPVGSHEWMNDYNRARRKTSLGRIAMARSNLLVTHGLTLEQYDELYQRQRGLCAICRREMSRAYTAESDGKRGPKPNGAHVDHDHGCCPGRTSCGRCVRGLLCHWCNSGVSMFRDKPELMRLAIEYLERPRLAY
jgi:hypothetical protein